VAYQIIAVRFCRRSIFFMGLNYFPRPRLSSAKGWRRIERIDFLRVHFVGFMV
jgi:hypothetical protein